MPEINAESGQFFTLQIRDLEQSVSDRAYTPHGSREAFPDYGFEIDTWMQLSRAELRAAIERAMRSDELVQYIDMAWLPRGQVEATINSAVVVGFAVTPQNIRESSGIRGLEYWPVLNSVVRIGVSAGNHDGVSYDLREYLRFATAPIEVVREFAADVQLGAYTRAFDTAVERALATRFYRMYSNRNKRPALDTYFSAIGAAFVTNYTAVGGHRYGSIDVCVSAVPTALISHQAVLTEIRRAVEWLLPFYEAGTTLTVSACEEYDTSIRIGAAFRGRTLLDLRKHDGS